MNKNKTIAELKKLWRILPIFLIVGFLLGLATAITRISISGNWSLGLWRTTIHTVTTAVNYTLYGALTVAVLLMATAAAQVLAGRAARASLRTATGVFLFYPVFFAMLWAFVNRAVLAFHLETHKMPQIVRKNDDFVEFMREYVLSYLDFTAIYSLFVEQAGWILPSLFLAVLFGVWFDRLGASLEDRWRRRQDRRPAAKPAAPTKPRRWIAITGLIAAGVATLLANMAAKAADLTNREPRPNIILISIDTLRADRLGCYGNPRAQTPFLDLLAKNGVLFEEAVSNSSWTLPGHGAMLTGVQPTALGLQQVTDRLSPKALTLAEVLKENGFDTGAIVSYILMDKVYGFDQGFDFFDYVDNRPAAQTVDQAISYLEPRRMRKFFLFLHLYDTHWPYEPTEETARARWPFNIGADVRHLIDTTDFAQYALKIIQGPRVLNDYSLAMYDAEVSDVDRELGRLFRYLVEKNLIDRTVVIVTSDHGEEFLEHGLFGHGLTLYEESVRVPLIMRFPHLLPAGARVKGQVQLLDIFPTALGLLGLDPSRYALGGRDLLLSIASGAVDPLPIVLETSMSGDPRYAVRTGQSKLLTPFSLDFGHGLTVTKTEEIYDLLVDPGETKNLAPDHPKMAEVLQAELATRLSAIRERWGVGEKLSRSQALSAEEIERLRSLGYLN